MLQFLSKLNLYTELVPETVHYFYPAKFIGNYHYHHHLKKYPLKLGHHIESLAHL